MEAVGWPNPCGESLGLAPRRRCHSRGLFKRIANHLLDSNVLFPLLAAWRFPRAVSIREAVGSRQESGSVLGHVFCRVLRICLPLITMTVPCRYIRTRSSPGSSQASRALCILASTEKTGSSILAKGLALKLRGREWLRSLEATGVPPEGSAPSRSRPASGQSSAGRAKTWHGLRVIGLGRLQPDKHGLGTLTREQPTIDASRL